ncbi:MAG TPA: T9SS type A sorting domain-containing protein [Saprospiraceae bacterium]|nr:T9SS type A sorting domain-containing protein [Saprospiraceae bacterium]
MKKHATLLLFLIFAHPAIQAQCPTSPVLLTTQAQVNAFPPTCTYLNVRFEVRGAGITDLTPLSNLTGSSKNVYINFNPDLTTLAGLENITEILGDFTIQANHALTDLHGLEGLANTPALLKVENNNGLLTLDGLTAGGVLTFIGSLVVIENDNLTDLGNVFDAVETVPEYVYIQDNADLPTLNTFNNLTSVGWYLNIENLPSLTALNAFGSLQSVGTGSGPSTAKDFEVINCPALTTLNDFTSLSQLGRNFELSGNTSLTEMSFPSLTSVGGEMSITGNTSLSSLTGLGDFTLTGPLFIIGNTSLPECEAEGICDYLDVPTHAASISNNDPGCNNRNQVETACLLLPVELVFFRGNNDKDDVLLNWQTASEKGNAYFQVEHSEDGINFTALGEVSGMGTSVVLNDYSFRHLKPAKGENYYRLKQVDFDGAYTYSNMVRVETRRGFDAELYPNPTSGFAKLKGDLTEGAARLTDITGRLISEFQLHDQHVIDLTRQPEGIYFLEILIDSKQIVKKVVKQ